MTNIVEAKKGGSETLSQARFNTGEIYITRRATKVIRTEDVEAALVRHLRGDWGGVDEFDKRLNDVALENGNGLISVFRDANQKRFVILTMPDRSQTLVFTPAAG